MSEETKDLGQEEVRDEQDERLSAAEQAYMDSLPDPTEKTHRRSTN